MMQPGVSETWVMCGQKYVYNNATYYVTNLNLDVNAFYRFHMLATKQLYKTPQVLIKLKIKSS